MGIVEMLYMCNLVAIVGGGDNPRWPANKVMIWDDKEECCIAELSFKEAVRSVRFRRDVIVIATETHVYLYNLHTLELCDHIETISNKSGILVTSMDPHQLVIACPAMHKGKVLVSFYKSVPGPEGSLQPSRDLMTIIAAHETSVVACALTPLGKVLATASEKGTIVRTFDSHSGRQLEELRRGADRAIMYSLTFDRTGHWLAAASDKSTIHIWTIDAENKGKNNFKNNNFGSNINNSSIPNDDSISQQGSQQGGAGNNINNPFAADALSENNPFGPSPSAAPISVAGGSTNLSASISGAGGNNNKDNVKSKLAFMASVLPSYFNSSWSCAHAKLTTRKSGALTIVAFTSDSSKVVAVSSDGSVELFHLTEGVTEKGVMKKASIATILDTPQ